MIGKMVIGIHKPTVVMFIIVVFPIEIAGGGEVPENKRPPGLIGKGVGTVRLFGKGDFFLGAI